MHGNKTLQGSVLTRRSLYKPLKLQHRSLATDPPPNQRSLRAQHEGMTRLWFQMLLLLFPATRHPALHSLGTGGFRMRVSEASSRLSYWPPSSSARRHVHAALWGHHYPLHAFQQSGVSMMTSGCGPSLFCFFVLFFSVRMVYINASYGLWGADWIHLTESTSYLFITCLMNSVLLLQRSFVIADTAKIFRCVPHTMQVSHQLFLQKERTPASFSPHYLSWNITCLFKYLTYPSYKTVPCFF